MPSWSLDPFRRLPLSACRTPWKIVAAALSFTGSGITLETARAAGDLGPDAQFHPPVAMGTLAPLGSNEVSGIAAATVHDDVFWVLNDRSDPAPRVFAIRSTGEALAQVTVVGASKTDWEDLAIGPGPEGASPYIYIADTGTNLDPRQVISIWRIPEPRTEKLDADQMLFSDPAVEIRVRYEVGMRDVEAMVVEPLTGTLYLFSKVPERTEVLRVRAAPEADGVHVAELAGSVSISNLVTGADMSPDGARLLLRTYSQVAVLERGPAVTFEDMLETATRVLPSPAEPQGESIAWDREGRDYLTVSEGPAVPIYRMFRKVLQPCCRTGIPLDSPLRFVRGDILPRAGDPTALAASVTDAAALAAMLAGGFPPGECPDRADANDDGALTKEDLELLVRALLRGTRLPAPSPAPGVDPTADGLPCHEVSSIDVVREDADWAYWYRTDSPATGWKNPDLDDSTWPHGPGGIGFGGSSLGTELERAAGGTGPLYARCEFSLEGAGPIDATAAIALDVDAVHGFVAYVNGTEVARGGLGEPGFEVPRELPAAPRRGGVFETHFICSDLLTGGSNLLAIEVHSRAPADASLYFRARLRTFLVGESGPEKPPPPRAEATLSVVPAGPIVDGRRGTLHVLLDTSEPVLAASWYLEHSNGLRIVDASPGAALEEGFDFHVHTSLFGRSVAQLFVPDFARSGDAVLLPGESIELAILTYEVGAPAGAPVHVGFAERESTGLGLQSTITIEGYRSVSPETVDLEAFITSGDDFIRGDCNSDGDASAAISDAIALLQFNFTGGPSPSCLTACDANGDGVVRGKVTDAVYLLQFHFLGGPPPPPPFPECGPSDRATDAALGCAAPPECR